MKKVLKYSLIFLLIATAYFLAFGKVKTNISNKSDASTNSKTCNRTIRYNNPPEFDRALSLIAQKMKDSNVENLILPAIPCVIVNYGDVTDSSGAEGYLLVKPDQNPNKLTIYVDKSYKQLDNLTNAILLIHELSHANEYLEFDNNLTCYQKEYAAFMMQWEFIKHLNDGERTLLTSNIYYYSNNNPQMLLVKSMLDKMMSVAGKCNNEANKESCFDSELFQFIKQTIDSNDYYKEQCSS